MKGIIHVYEYPKAWFFSVKTKNGSTNRNAAKRLGESG